MIIIHPSTAVASVKYMMALHCMKIVKGKKYMHLVPDADKYSRMAVRILRCEL